MTLRRLLPSLVATTLAFACDSTGENTTHAGGAGGSGGTSSGGSGGAGANSGGNGGSGLFITTGGMGGGAGAGGEACVGTKSVAEPIPLDLYVMLDASGSMLDKTGMMGMGAVKWDAIKSAITSFVEAPASSGIGVGLQYFPLVAAGAPSSCTSDAQCGAFGPCFLKICEGDGSVCSSNGDCGPGAGPCSTIGQCANDPATFCLPIGANCPGMKGQCVQVQTSFCINQDSCDPADYATPAVPIAPLPGVAQPIIDSMNAKAPEGATPTASALQGAIDRAALHAAANPTHTVVAVLATDGVPTECAPLDFAGISSIAATGLAGSPSIKTFVIGIFKASDNVQGDLDMLAQAGGTGQAFLVDAGGNVEQAFLDALVAIQGSKLACEYLIPPPPMGETLDYGKVNVLHTDGGNATPVGYVPSVADCDPVLGGWYYDQDPAMGGVPTKVLMCPATCDAFASGGSVDIELGCVTVILPPN